MIKQRFKITDYLEVILTDDDKIEIRINGERFMQCTHVLTTIHTDEIENVLLLESVDEIQTENTTVIDVDTRFFVHRSNLQAWVENCFDTRMLHSNLSFPILKRLVEIGVVKETLLKEEVAKRFECGNDAIRDFLILNDYTKLLTKKELRSILPPECDILREIEIETNGSFVLYSPQEEYLYDDFEKKNQLGFFMINNKIAVICFFNYDIQNRLSRVFKILSRINYDEDLLLSYNSLVKIPEDIVNLTSLKSLILDHNPLEILTDSIGNLKLLLALDLSHTNLTTIPDSIGNLKSLLTLVLSHTNLTTIPDSIGNLKSLQHLDLSHTNLTTIPDSIGNLKSLQHLDLSHTNLTTIPDSIGNLKSLRYLNLSRTNLTKIPKSVKNLKIPILNTNFKN